MKVILEKQIEEILERYFENEMLIDILKSMNVTKNTMRKVFSNYEG
jgi:hypothetical protein